MTEPLSSILSPGELVAGRYRMVAAIAQGGMGSVWKALDERAFNQAVAVKVIRSKNVSDAVKSRFIDEAKVISKLNSPHIVGLREFGETEAGYPFFVMDLLEGQTVTERLATGGPCSERDGALIIDGVLAGLQEIHLQGVVHRDLKPSNVFLEQSSAIDAHVRILDLGIAQLVEGDRKGGTSRAKRVIGTPRWMAPEVLLGEAASPVSDIYSVGLLGILVLGGEIPHSKFGRDGTVHPFDRSCIIQRLGSNSVKVVGRRGLEPVSDAFCHVLEDALWREPADRYQDALAFRVALREALPQLGMPTLPLVPTSNIARSLSVAPEHTMLDDGALLHDDETNLSVDFDPEVFGTPARPHENDPPMGGEKHVTRADSISDSLDEVMSSSKPMSLQELRQEELSQSIPEVQTPRSQWRHVVMLGLSLMVGLLTAWVFFGDGSNSDEQLGHSSTSFSGSNSVSPRESVEQDAQVRTVTSKALLSTDSQVRVDSALSPDGSAESISTKSQVANDFADESRAQTRAGVKQRKAANRDIKKSQKTKSLKAQTASKAGKARTIDSLGRRCRTQFREIVRDSEGGSLVQGSTLCSRVRALVKEATKPKCSLTSSQRKELGMLGVLCTESP